MENWPIYKLCDQYKIPVISVRAVLDEACEEIPESLINFLNILKAKKLKKYFSILKLLLSFSNLKFSIKANNSIKSYSRIIINYFKASPRILCIILCLSLWPFLL
jgi:hypothetical protein